MRDSEQCSLMGRTFHEWVDIVNVSQWGKMHTVN